MRLMFGGGSADFSIAAPSATLGILHSAPNLTSGTAWTAQTGGTRIMDLAKVSPTDPTPVAADPDGRILPFLGPDEAIPSTLGLWVDLGSGVRQFVAAHMTAEQLDATMSGRITDGSSATATAVGAMLRKRSVSVLDYGAKGDGMTDDTAAIDAALTANPGRTIHFPAGTYSVDGTRYAAPVNTCAIRLRAAGTRLVLDPGATIAAATTTSGAASVMVVTAADCSVQGGTIKGDLVAHTATGGEWSHGIVAWDGGDRFQALGVRVIECWGDGFNISGTTGPKDVRLIDCIADSNRRQGLSIISGTGARVIGGAYINTGAIKGTAPMDGIDVEPNPSSAPVVNFQVIGARLSGNKGAGLHVVCEAGGANTSGVASGNIITGNVVGVLVSSNGGTFAVRLAGNRVAGNTTDRKTDIGTIVGVVGEIGRQTWTPVLTATTTNPTGYTATGTYTLDSSGTVVVTYAITFNADFSPGSGRYLLSVPVALAGSPVAVAYTMFAGSVRTTVGANSKVYAPVYIDGGGLINLSDPNGALLNEAGPGVAWASGAMIRGVVIYPSIAA